MGMIRSVLFGKGNFAADRPRAAEQLRMIDWWTDGGFIVGLRASYSHDAGDGKGQGEPLANALHGAQKGAHGVQALDVGEQVVAAVAFKGGANGIVDDGICGLLLYTTKRIVRIGEANTEVLRSHTPTRETTAVVNPDCFEIVGNIKGFYSAWNEGMPLRQIGFVFNDIVLRSMYDYDDNIHAGQLYTIANTRNGGGQLRLTVVPSPASGAPILTLVPHPAPHGLLTLASHFGFDPHTLELGARAMYALIDGQKKYVAYNRDTRQFEVGVAGQALDVRQEMTVRAKASDALMQMHTIQWYVLNHGADDGCMCIDDQGRLAWQPPRNESAMEWIITRMPH